MWLARYLWSQTEDCHPDRSRAISLCLGAWKLEHCNQVGDLDVVVEEKITMTHLSWL